MTQTALPARIAVSTVIFSLQQPADEERHAVVLPLVRRTRDPHHGQWALPGGWLDVNESLDAAASRTLEETTGLTHELLEQLYAFGAVDPSPTRRVVSIVYWALVREDETHAVAQENVRWFDAAALPPLAFDHAHVASYALWRLRNKVGYSRIAHGLLADESPSPSCARCTRRSSAAASTPRTSAARWRARGPSSRQPAFAPAATAPPASTATTRTSSWPTAARSTARRTPS